MSPNGWLPWHVHALFEAKMNIALDSHACLRVRGLQLAAFCFGGATDRPTSSSACFDPWQSRQHGCLDLSGGKTSRRSCSSQGTLMLPPISVTLRMTVCIAWGAGAAEIICWLARARTCWFARKTGILCSWPAQTGSCRWPIHSPLAGVTLGH